MKKGAEYAPEFLPKHYSRSHPSDNIRQFFSMPQTALLQIILTRLQYSRVRVSEYYTKNTYTITERSKSSIPRAIARLHTHTHTHARVQKEISRIFNETSSPILYFGADNFSSIVLAVIVTQNCKFRMTFARTLDCRL